MNIFPWNISARTHLFICTLLKLEKINFPKYQDSASIVKTPETAQRIHSRKRTADLNKQGEAFHKETNTIIQIKQAEIDETDIQHKAAIEKQEDEIYTALNGMKQTNLDFKSLLDTSGVCPVSKYRSRFHFLPNSRFPFETFCLRRSTERNF